MLLGLRLSGNYRLSKEDFFQLDLKQYKMILLISKTKYIDLHICIQSSTHILSKYSLKHSL